MSRTISDFQRYCFLVLVLVSFCASTLAQHSSEGLGGTFSTPAGGTITKSIVDRIAQRSQERKVPARRSGANSTTRTSSPSSATKSNQGSVLFRPTGTQLKTLEIANLIDAGNPQIVKLLTVLLDEFDKGARAAGHPNDLALALSFFFATNASIYHDGGQPGDPQMVELRDTIAETLADGNALSSLSDREKQEMYETLVLFTGFTLATYEEGKQSSNAETVNVSRQLAGQNLLAVTGISPDKINFTDQGLSIEREIATAPAAVVQPATEMARPQEAAVATIHAGKLVMEFEGNEVRALQLYGGHRIRVNGTVNSLEVLKDGRITLTFHSPAGGYAMTRCYFNKSQSSRLAQLSGGREGIVEGTVRGFGGGFDGRGYVELENCTVP